jgi:hypothetical protein
MAAAVSLMFKSDLNENDKYSSNFLLVTESIFEILDNDGLAY